MKPILRHVCFFLNKQNRQKFSLIKTTIIYRCGPLLELLIDWIERNAVNKGMSLIKTSTLSLDFIISAGLCTPAGDVSCTREIT